MSNTMVEKEVKQTTSLCTFCKISIPATIWKTKINTVVMRRSCPTHGPQEALVSSNADWYEDAMSFPAVTQKPQQAREVKQGCPFDCGPCKNHEQKLQLPIVPITSSCNLNCPICYTHNKNKEPYRMSEDELRSILKHLREDMPDKRIINLTGGEPTQHPSFERLIELCQEEGIHRITLSTHGLRFIKEEHLLEKLASLDARVILSFDSFKSSVNQEMLGGKLLESKMKIIENLEKYGVNTTILPVLAKGLNDDELGSFIKLAFSKDFIRSVEFHPMTFTGQNGSQFDRKARYTTFDVLNDLERQTEGRIRISDFVPSPAAHSLCYSVTYLMQLLDGSWLPFPRFMSRQDLREMLGGGLYLEPSPELDRKFNEVLNKIWSGEFECENSDLVMASLKDLSQRLFSPTLSEIERMRLAERASKAVYVHAHMDDENFDSDRIKQCCVGIREPDGKNIPSCAYNILYRNRDHRFTVNPEPPISTLGMGRL